MARTGREDNACIMDMMLENWVIARQNNTGHMILNILDGIGLCTVIWFRLHVTIPKITNRT